MNDIDPSVLMAEHQKYAGTATACRVCIQPWPCLPYRLAQALVAAQEDVARLSAYSAAAFDQRDAAQDALAASEAKVAQAWDEGRQAEFHAGGRHAQPLNPYCAALADQPEQVS